MKGRKPNLRIDTSTQQQQRQQQRNQQQGATAIRLEYSPNGSINDNSTTTTTAQPPRSPFKKFLRTRSISKLVRHRHARVSNSVARSYSASTLPPLSPPSPLPSPFSSSNTSSSSSSSGTTSSSSNGGGSGCSTTTSSSCTKPRVKKRKILQLGVNWGGKTTIFKSVKVLYSNGYNETERASYRDIIFSNILYSTRCLIEHALQDESIVETDKKFIRDYGSPILDMFADFTIERNVLHLVPDLWNHPAIQKAYRERNRLFHIPEIAYWMEDIERVLSPSFTPTVSDVMRSRVKTTGIVYSTFNVSNYDIQLIDVGSERNERKKWYSCFEEVTDLMYVVALDEYPMLCYEDNETNRLRESLACWLEVANSHFFSPSAVNIFLVFNKADLFKEKIQSGCALDKYFPGYTGGSDPNKALAYIVDLFLKRIRDKRKIHVCVTNALDLDCMQRFWKCVVSIPTLVESDDDNQPKYTTTNDFTLKEEWCWQLRHEASSCLKLKRDDKKICSDDYSPFIYHESEPHITTYPIAYSDCDIADLSFGFYSDITLVTKDRPNIHLQAHSFILSVRSTKFFELIVSLKAKNEGLRRIETASFRNVSYGIISVDFVSHNMLKHILSLIYNNTFYPYASRDDKLDFEQICQLNKDLELTDKSEVELTEMYQRFYSPEQHVLLEEQSPLKRFSKAIKQRSKKVLKMKLSNKKHSVPHCSTSPLFNGIPSYSFGPTLFETTPMLEPPTRLNDLAVAFMQLNNNEKKFNYDLHIYGVDSADGNVIKAHKFICYEYLPDYNNDGDSYITYPFFNFRSYLHALSYMYCGGGEFFESMVSNSLTLHDVLHCMHISRLWSFDKDDMFFKSLLIRLARMLTVENVCSILNEFEEDELNFSRMLGCNRGGHSSAMFIGDTTLSKLPVEIHFLILAFSCNAPVASQQHQTCQTDCSEENDFSALNTTGAQASPTATTPTLMKPREEEEGPKKEYRVINQDSLGYLLFTSHDFLTYLQLYYPEYLYCKTANMSAYGAVRSLCSEFISLNFKQVQQQQQWNEISDQTKQKILADVYHSAVVTVIESK